MANDGDSPVEVSGSITVTDILGIGKAVSSPAAREIVRAFSSPLQIFLEGKAKASATKTAMITEAKAEVQAALIRDDQRELLKRAGQRLVAQEGAKQLNLEAAVELAIEHLESQTQSSSQKARALDDGWILRWMDGAQYASSSAVRKIWARILASEAQDGATSVSAPSLALLSQLDPRLANAFTEYVRLAFSYGCFPWQGKARFKSDDLNSFATLREIGFLAEQELRSYRFLHFDLVLRGSHVPIEHRALVLSHRGLELGQAVFGAVPLLSEPLKGREPPEDEQVRTLTDVASALIERSRVRMPTVLSFKGKDGVPVAEMALVPHGDGIVWQGDDAIAELIRLGALLNTISEGVVRALVQKHSVLVISKSAVPASA